jgi:hypothetical protein
MVAGELRSHAHSKYSDSPARAIARDTGISDGRVIDTRAAL